MSIETDADQDRTTGIGSVVPWHASELEVLPNFSLRVGFPDGTRGIVRMEGLVSSKAAGVFEVLKDPALFAQAYLDFGAVTWPGDLDIAPDAMYDEIKANGEWILD